MSIVKCSKCGRILATREVVFDKETFVCEDCRRDYKTKLKESSK